MKIQFPRSFGAGLVLALLAAGSSFAAAPKPAQHKSAQAPAAPPQVATQSDVEKKAEALSEAQIDQSRDVASLSQLGQLYSSLGDIPRFAWVLKRLTQLMPDSGQLKLQLALAYADQKDLTKAYDVLVRMQGQGFGYDLSKDPRFDSIHGNKVWDYIVTNLQVNGKQFGEGKVAFELPKGDHLFESMSYDPKRKQFLVGSVREGKVYLADQNGKLTDFINADAANGMWAVLDMGVDSAHDKLYVASAGVAYYKGFNEDSFGQSGIFEFQLSTGKFLKKYTFPQIGEKHLLSHIVVGKDGRVYAADGDRRQIYKLDGGELKLLAENLKLAGIRGLALSDDGKTLYFADSSFGIFGMDLTKSEPFVLARNPDKLVLGGIDGLYFYDGCLITIANGMEPQRVMRLKLSADGRGVVSAMPLDVAQPAFTMPTLGAVAGDGLYFIANSQKAMYDQYGVLKDASKLEPVKIFRSNLRFAWDQSGITTGLMPMSRGAPDPARKPQNEAPEKGSPKSNDGKH
jgi:sugar lactone lactonase YvrE